MTPDALISLATELGLGSALGISIFLLLRRTLDRAGLERTQDREERAALIGHLVEEGRETREVLRSLDRTLAEVRLAVVQQKPDVDR